MSHFIVAVITKEPAKYHEELAPYQENNMCDCPKEFLEFVDKTEEFKKSWQEESVKKIKLPNGNYLSPHDNRLKVAITKEEYEKLRKERNHDVCFGSEGWGKNETYHKYDPSVANGIVVEVPYREIYATLDDYVKDREGEDLWDSEMKAYGWWKNPNAKWDSYSLCAKGNYSRWQDATIESAFCKVSEYPLYKSKQELINQYNRELEDVKLGKTPKVLFDMEYGSYKNAEDFAIRCRVQAPWAFVLDKHWAEQGEMGWWGMHNGTNETEKSFKELFEQIMTDPKYQDYYIGFVNCHI